MALVQSGLDLDQTVQFFAHRTSRRTALKNSLNQISDFFTNSLIPDFDDTLLREAVEDCVEWKRYIEQDIDDIEILYERFDGTGRVLSTLSDEDEVKASKEAAKFKLDGKLFVQSGLHQTPISGKKQKFQFPLPRGDGLKRLNTPTDFQIPWNIYCPTVAGERNTFEWKHTLKRNQWLFENPFKDIKPTWNVCHCTGMICGNRCINRTLQHECSPYNCKFGSRDCGNRAFTNLANDTYEHKKYATAYEVVQTKTRGCGLFAVRQYNPGSLVIEYTGEVIDLVEVEHKMNTVYKDVDDYYFVGLEGNYVIDAGQKGSVARFANHSCEPNAEMQKWYVNNEPRIGLFAKRPIEAGEEITYDYNLEWFENAQLQKCYCGSKKCRRFIVRGADAAEDSEDEPIAVTATKKASQYVSNPVKPTIKAESSPEYSQFSGSELEDSDIAFCKRLLDALDNAGISSSDSESTEESIEEPKQKPRTTAKSKYTPGVKMKAVVVEDNPVNKENKSPPKQPDLKKKVFPTKLPAKSLERNAGGSSQMGTTRRSLYSGFDNIEVAASLPINKVPSKDCAYNKTDEINKLSRRSDIAENHKTTVSKKQPGASDNSKKRPAESIVKPTHTPKRPKLITDTDSGDEISAVSGSEITSDLLVSSHKADVQEISFNASTDLPKSRDNRNTFKGKQNLRMEPKSRSLDVPNSRKSGERFRPLNKKNSVFSKRKEDIGKKSMSEKSANYPRTTSIPNSLGPNVFSLKKSKRRDPTRTTDTYYPSSTGSQRYTPAGNELVLAESKQDQTGNQRQRDPYYDDWKHHGYYGENNQGYYADQYYSHTNYDASMPPIKGQRLIVVPDGCVFQAHEKAPQDKYVLYHQRQETYYPPHYQLPRQHPGHQTYYPPPPSQAPQPQRPAVNYHPEYYNGNTDYPSDASTVDAEASQSESFSNDVLQQPEGEKEEPPKRRESSNNIRGVPIDPRRRR